MIVLVEGVTFFIKPFIPGKHPLLTGVSELLVINELLASLIFLIISWNEGLSVGLKAQHLFMKEMKDSGYLSFLSSKLVKYWLKLLAIICSFNSFRVGALSKITSSVRTS